MMIKYVVSVLSTHSAHWGSVVMELSQDAHMTNPAGTAVIQGDIIQTLICFDKLSSAFVRLEV